MEIGGVPVDSEGGEIDRQHPGCVRGIDEHRYPPIAAQGGKGEITMSWQGPEAPGEIMLDSHFSQPGVVYFASSGDGPGVQYPSASPNVVGVGGTTLSRNADTGAFLMSRAAG